jgi:hypothetical protein
LHRQRRAIPRPPRLSSARGHRPRITTKTNSKQHVFQFALCLKLWRRSSCPKRRSSAALQNVAANPIPHLRLRFGVRRCSGAFNRSNVDRSHRTRRFSDRARMASASAAR